MERIVRVIIICILLGLLCIVLFMLNASNHKPKLETYNDKVQNIINKIENKESFNLFIYSENDDSQLIKDLEYYSKVYNLEYDSIKKNYKNELYKLMISKIDADLSEADDAAFLIVKNGKVDYGINGLFSENNLRRILIQSNIISKEYEDIDHLLYDSEVKDYYNKNELYNVLYISSNDKNLYKFREILVNEKIKSLIVYSNSLESVDTSTSFEEQLGILDEAEKKLPILMHIKNNRILNSFENVTVEHLVEICK